MSLVFTSFDFISLLHAYSLCTAAPVHRLHADQSTWKFNSQAQNLPIPNSFSCRQEKYENLSDI